MLYRKRRLIELSTRLKRGRLLDIGSGSGHFAGSMKNSGWLVSGIEINEKARKESSERFGIEISEPGEILQIESSSVDCVTMWHVLEHFSNPDWYLTEIRRILKPGGFCIIALPNNKSIDALYYREYWAAWDVPRHLWHYSPESFRVLANKYGFKLQQVHDLPADVFYISYLSEKYRNTAFPFFTGILKAKIFTLKRLLQGRQKSSSLIYTLLKS